VFGVYGLNSCICCKPTSVFTAEVCYTCLMLPVIFLCLPDSDDHSILKWNLLSDETTQVHVNIDYAFFFYLMHHQFKYLTFVQWICLSFLIYILYYRSLSYQQKSFQLIYTGFHEVLEAKSRASLSCSYLPLLMVTKLISQYLYFYITMDVWQNYKILSFQ